MSNLRVGRSIGHGGSGGIAPAMDVPQMPSSTRPVNGHTARVVGTLIKRMTRATVLALLLVLTTLTISAPSCSRASKVIAPVTPPVAGCAVSDRC